MVEDPRAGVIHRRIVPVLEIDHPVGEGPHRQGVRADEHLAVAKAHHQGRSVAGAEDHVLAAADQHAQGIGAAQAVQGGLEGVEGPKAVAEVLVDKMGDHLGVGVAGEDPAPGLELGLELGEVLDDAVVHHGDPASDVGVGVAFGGAPMGGPAGVADAGLARQGLGLEDRFQFAQLAWGAPAFQHAVDLGGHPGGVIAAIFEPAQAVDQTRRHLSRPDNTDNAAHCCCLPAP